MKAQSFDFARNLLGDKLNAKVSGDSVITVIGDHFPIPTTTAEQEARRVISQFRDFFGDVSNFAPTVFWTEKEKPRQVLCTINLDLLMCAI